MMEHPQVPAPRIAPAPMRVGRDCRGSMRSRLRRAVELGASITALCAAVANATSLEPRDIRQVAAVSAQIVLATAMSSSSHWNDAHTLVVTETRLRVLRTLKGQAESEVVVTSPGGKIGKLVVDVPGGAPLRPGQEAILFLVGDAKGKKAIEGLSRGRFDVAVDGRTGQRIV